MSAGDAGGGDVVRVLVYKRTHNGDPDAGGCFGANDCMGIVRKRAFDAVIGVGGLGPEARQTGVAGRINWIGIGPHKVDVPDKRGPEVTFDRFLDFGTEGPSFREEAPVLAERMYARNIRAVLEGLTAVERAEVARILEMAKGAGPSPERRKRKGGRKCRVERQVEGKTCRRKRGVC